MTDVFPKSMYKAIYLQTNFKRPYKAILPDLIMYRYISLFYVVTGEGLRQLELFPNLEEVYLSQNSLVDDVTLLRLSACCKSLR